MNKMITVMQLPVNQEKREQTTWLSSKNENGSKNDPEIELRSQTYALLAALLVTPPNSELINLLKGIRVSEDDRSSPMAPVWDALKLSADAANVEELNDEFHDLFIGMGRGELVPYASWYLTGFLMEKPLAVLRSTLSSLGIERQKGVHEPEDHVAALCESMRIILGQHPEIDFQQQQAFFREHVAPWMGKFFRDLSEAQSAKFYRSVGQLGEQFLALEKQYFSMLT